MILDLKKDELAKFKFLSMLDISKKEVKQLAKKDPSIMKAIGKQGGSFRTSLVRQNGQPTTHNEDAPTVIEPPAIAGTGDDSSTVVVRKKKKKQIITGDKPMTRLDGRTKAYKLHAKITSTKREKTKTKRGQCENLQKD